MKNTDIQALVMLFQESGLNEMHLIHDGDELFLSRDGSARIETSASALPGTSDPSTAPPPVAPASAALLSATGPDRTGWIAVKAANLGTFYRAPTPESPAYVEIGQSVEPETEVCLIEVMKLFTTLQAGVSGIVREFAVADGEMVEFDQTLMWVEPQSAQ